ncbi:hypothetical protein [Beijerinckia indica]|uniref:Uncharacterized protein n=1 Tax=Beijerinckia indica subsp. indica (strain ATCC 9039 / DSM 1715 / NCIMB 8712) TaxID=395963 RepID=B2III1_BEII9|nr:hypothetical protein [Beijerinckia indica]ACB94762.1 hypothetical protein Bind_1120 [Beijerinckia indica subsp. indica ATCC 9039]
MKTTFARCMALALFCTTMLAAPLSASAQDSVSTPAVPNPMDGVKSQAAGTVKAVPPTVPQGVTNPVDNLKGQAAETVKQATPAVPKNPVEDIKDTAAKKAKAQECIDKANAQGLHGKARKKFKSKCKKQ